MNGPQAAEGTEPGELTPVRDLRQDKAWLQQSQYSLADLALLTAFLRSPAGCPWDRVQTASTLRQGFLEEAYEVCDAIELQDATALCEELGDVLLNVIFQVQLAEEAGQFDFQAVTTAVCRKLIDRHSYVFTDPSNPVPAADQTEALKQWEANKRQEKQQRSYLDTLNGVARALPALRRAQKLQSKAQKAGLKLRPDRQQIMAQLAAVSTTLEQPDQARPGRLPGSTQRSATAAMQQAAGSLLFSLVAYLAERQIDPEAALDQTNQTFVRRFAAMEQQAMARGQSLDELEVNQLWQAEQQPDPENIN